MFESQPLIGVPAQGEAVGKTSNRVYAKIIVAVFIAALVAVGGYFGYEFLFASNHHSHHGKLSPSRIAMITEENGYTVEAQSDLITYLPNLNEEMTFNMFSGYLEATNNREIFYWFEESQSETADTDPLIIWTNGGPGCSGLVGLLTEHGAYWVYDDLTLKSNEYSWNKIANMLYVEQPYGVGFSIVSDGDSYVTGDDNAATDIDAVVRSFLTKYPKYQSNDFYVASESYGGHYVPFSTKKILENNAKGLEPTVNIKGMLVGNPLSSYYHNDEGFMSALYGHGLIKATLYNEWNNECYGNENAILYSDTCYMLYVQAYLAAEDADFYALDFPTCNADDDDTMKKDDKRTFHTERKQFRTRARERVSKVMENEELLNKYFEGNTERIDSFKIKAESAIGSSTAPYLSCAEDNLVDYLNLESVQTALHTKVSSDAWDYCNYALNEAWPESDWYNDMTETYNILANDYDIKMLMYSGDDDSVCSIQGAMSFLDTLGFEIDSNYDWSEWKYEDELAGYYTRYLKSDGTSTALHFQTVRSAGHMVPSTQPERALELFNRFFNYYSKDM